LLALYASERPEACLRLVGGQWYLNGALTGFDGHRLTEHFGMPHDGGFFDPDTYGTGSVSCEALLRFFAAECAAYDLDEDSWV
jgi:hypothetical protein